MIDVIESFAVRQPGAGALTVTRTTPANPPYDAHGRKVAPSTATLPIVALVIPTNGRDLQIKVDCRITTDIRALLTATKLSAAEAGPPALAPDTLTGVDLDAEVWTVFHIEKWPSPDGDTFYRTLVAKRSLQ